MTKTVAAPSQIRTDTPCARLQFTLRELIIFVVMTFLGMCVLVPRVFGREPILGCATIIIATASGAVLGASCCAIRSRCRALWMISGVGTAWLAILASGLAILMYDGAVAERLSKFSMPFVVAILFSMRLLAPLRSAATKVSASCSCACLALAVGLTPACVMPRTFMDEAARAESDLAKNDRAASEKVFFRRQFFLSGNGVYFRSAGGIANEFQPDISWGACTQ